MYYLRYECILCINYYIYIKLLMINLCKCYYYLARYVDIVLWVIVFDFYGYFGDCCGGEFVVYLD